MSIPSFRVTEGTGLQTQIHMELTPCSPVGGQMLSTLSHWNGQFPNNSDTMKYTKAGKQNELLNRKEVKASSRIRREQSRVQP
jgi:hypothetical protein